MEDTKRMIFSLNQRNVMFVRRKDILHKYADQKVLDIIEKPTQFRKRKRKIQMQILQTGFLTFTDYHWETSKSPIGLMWLSIQWKSPWKSIQEHQLVLYFITCIYIYITEIKDFISCIKFYVTQVFRKCYESKRQV